MVITNNVSGVFPYEICERCDKCKPYLRKAVVLSGGDEDEPDKTLYEVHCSHQEACGRILDLYFKEV